ncbi:expressed unknown protein [Seminavis robusta]|uniref:Uncharacterized protein n=1 Tax=Seminavis robusta TaxID=568900 RepID=A0A9N8HYK0_9STRA|nr:expressed unknown protein [Seminavis robusta]CAB9530457.1 expressed unknown protein [Seminavis robusta]|eukprot:Sro1647_g288340.1 n/a (256) ;mRNA; f:1647-2414
MTNSMRDTILADETIGPVVREVERTLLFTDVPCGAMKTRDCDQAQCADTDDDVAQGFLKFCGGLERAFCFTDLEDIDESEMERIKSLSVIENATSTTTPVKDTPIVETADTESCSDDSNPAAMEVAIERPDPPSELKESTKEEETAAPTEGAAQGGDVAQSGDAEVTEEAVAKAEETGTPLEISNNEAPRMTQSEPVLPPANAMQASTNTLNKSTPTNSLQAAKAAKAAKNKDGKKKRKSWGLFRKSRSAKASVV